MLADEDIVDHVQHMGCEKMDVELIESDDDGVDMGPPKMTLVECKESLKGIANFIAQNASLGDEDLLQVQRLANELLAMQATCVMNHKQEVIKKFFPVMGFYCMLSIVEVFYVQCWQKNMWLLFCVQIQFIVFVKNNGMHS